MMNNKIWKVDEIKRLLETNDIMVVRSLVKLYDYQTRDEKDDGDTKHHNGVGFNGCDGKILSSICCYYKKNKKLSDKQVALVRKKIMKYANQITKIANSENKLKGAI